MRLTRSTFITISELTSYDHSVHPERTLREVSDLLEGDKRIPGVMVAESGRFITALSRARLLEATRRRYSQELFWERPISELLARLDLSPTVLSATTSVNDAVSVALSRDEDALAEPIVCRDRNGRHRLIDMHALLAAQCRQLTEANERLAEASRQSEQASRAKSDFLANMSHEIRTPMTAILGYAELLQDEGVEPARRTSAARTIRRSGEHLLNILNDILDVSKIESGRLVLENLDHDPVNLIREVVELMRARAAEKCIAISLTVEEGLPPLVNTDPTRLRQIVSNLVGNAVKFTQRGAVRLHVSMDLRHGVGASLLRIEIEDTGIGVPASRLDTLFQPFEQGDASMSRRYGGSGLGLNISRKLARLLGGDITVSSIEGEGSRFVATVAANLNKVSGRVLTMAQTPDIKSAPLHARVLLAEDGLDNQRLFAYHMGKVGTTVDIASNGREALSMATATQYDLVLMDMQMPEMDGYEATRQLRKQGYTGPIVALTAHAMANDRDLAIAAGCDDYLTKPIGRDALLAAVRNWAATGIQRRAA